MGRLSMLVIAAAAGIALTGPSLAQSGAQPRAHHGGPGGGGVGWGLLDADANSDGRLTAAEFTAMQQARFSKIDANSDGAVTAAEIEARMRAGMEERRARMEQRLAEQGREGAARRRSFDPERMRARLQEGFAKQDADGDGALSFEEFSARGQDMFARLDQDQDGTVTLAEMKAARAERRGR